MTIWEMEVADAAYFMGYELMRSQDGYVLARQHGAQFEKKVPTLDAIRECLKQ